MSLALGHLVFGAAVLEKAMLADLIQRRVIRDGPEEVFGRRLVSLLERKPAGVLLAALRKLGYEDEIAEEITAVIDDRNHFVHHLFEDPEFIGALVARDGVEGMVTRIETLIEDIYGVVKRLEPGVPAGMETMFGRSSPELLDLLREIDPRDFEDGEEHRQLEALQGLPDDLVNEHRERGGQPPSGVGRKRP